MKKGESLRDTVETHRGHGRRRHRRAPRLGRRARGRSPRGSDDAGRSTPATAGTSTPPRPCSTATRSASDWASLRRAAHRHRRRHQAQPGGPLRRARLHRPRRRGHPRRPAHAAAAVASTGWPVDVSHDLDAVLPKADVVYLLRMQQERQHEALLPSLREYTARYGPHPRAGRACWPTTPSSCTPAP